MLNFSIIGWWSNAKKDRFRRSRNGFKTRIYNDFTEQFPEDHPTVKFLKSLRWFNINSESQFQQQNKNY